MSCCVGWNHTICLSDESIVHSFGANFDGQLGYSTTKDYVPRAITSLPLIKEISCAYNFTVCVDFDGFMWSFGYNQYSKLGIIGKMNYDSPQKIENVPPIDSISCGRDYCLAITNESDLWCFGYNAYGQLFLDGEVNKEIQPTKTKFTNVKKISTGVSISLFQTIEGYLYGSGNALNNSYYIKEDSYLYNQPPSIIQFCCGYSHALILTGDGLVYGIGQNLKNCLGFHGTINQTSFIQIQNVPLIKMISCVGWTSYLVDFDGNVWGFGDNQCGQLGRLEKTQIVPKQIECVKDIQQISSGSCSEHIFLKNSQNRIFSLGNNTNGQLGAEPDCEEALCPHTLDENISFIWGCPREFQKYKSARK